MTYPQPFRVKCCTNCMTKDCNNFVDLTKDGLMKQLLTNILDEETHRRISALDEVKGADSTDTMTHSRLTK